MDYKELTDKAGEISNNRNTRARENYRYARSLGFNSTEAMLLQYKDKEEIDRIAGERDTKEDAGK